MLKPSFSLKDYFSKQIRFSFGNLFSVPVGLAIPYLLVTFAHLWYEYGIAISFIITTVMNFNIQRFMKVIELKKH